MTSGYSYGTYVGGVYASVFSNFAGRIVLDGDMEASPRKEAQAVGDAIANDSWMDFLFLMVWFSLKLCRFGHVFFVLYFWVGSCYRGCWDVFVLGAADIVIVCFEHGGTAGEMYLPAIIHLRDALLP